MPQHIGMAIVMAYARLKNDEKFASNETCLASKEASTYEGNMAINREDRH